MQFSFRATGEFRGIIVLVEAESLDEAKAKAKSHDYESYEMDAAECVYLDINLSSGKSSE